MQDQLTAVIAKRGRWYVGYIEEIPGVNTRARTLKQLRENLREALELVLEANRELAGQTWEGEEITREPTNWRERSVAT